MEHVQLGRTGVSVSRFCLGAMMFGARSAHRPRASGRGPVHRLLHFPRLGDRGGPVGGTRPPPAALRHRATAVLDSRPRDRSRRSTHVRAPQHERRALQSAGRRLAVGPRQDVEQPASSRAGRLPERFEISLAANQRKLAAVEQLARLADEARITLIQLAIAFVLNHPAITAPIIGPRTMEHLDSQLAAAGGRRIAGPHRRDRPAGHDPSTQPTTPGPTRRSIRRRGGARSSPRRRGPAMRRDAVSAVRPARSISLASVE
jgi:Aldo/keto reductase family